MGSCYIRLVPILFILLQVAFAELVLVQQLSRHGSRSPKKGYEVYCPNDPWRWKWDTNGAGLTGPGQLEEHAIGQVTRAHYGHLIGAYNASRHSVRAADSDRVLQSAEVAMSSLFAPGSGPQGGLPGRPTFVPVHTVSSASDDLLDVNKGTCDQRATADYDQYWQSVGANVLSSALETVQPLFDFCGRNESTNAGLKMQVDGVGFDRAQGFLRDELSADAIFGAQNLSMALQTGQFWEDAARTYCAGSLPATLLSNMQGSVQQSGVHTKSYFAYFSHREALYAMAKFFGWEWHQKGIPAGMVYTGTSVFVELHRVNSSSYEVAMKQYYPHCGAANMSSCPLEPIKLAGCAKGDVCSMSEFQEIIETRVKRTGEYQNLCQQT